MKKVLLYSKILILFTFFSYNAQAQLPNGSIAPDWTLTDLDGNVWNLYALLDQGKTVYIDFSATWCGPCWNYHNTHALRDVYVNHGPNGTNEAMVFFIEGDLSTNEACLYGSAGCNGGTQGNWVATTPYPIINLTSANGPNVGNEYQISYWPTIYTVCPNRKIYLSGQLPYNSHKNYINSCALSMDNIVSNSVDCYADMDGFVDITTSGGYGNLSYSWSNGATTEDIINVPPGTYSVTVTEGNGMTVEASATIAGPSEELVINTINFQQIDCYGNNNGHIEVSASGGTAGYSFDWSNGSTSQILSNLPAGTYDLTLTDGNDCEVYESYTIVEPNELIVSVTTEPDACLRNDGQIIVTSSGGTGVHTYDIGNGPQMNNVFTDLAAGTYNLTVLDDNNCSVVQAVTVNEVLPPTIVLPPSPEIFPCDASTHIIDGTASETGPFIEYLWTTTNGSIVSGETGPALIIDAPGDYTFFVFNTEYNCVSSEVITVISDPNAPISNAGPNMLIECSNPSIQLDGTGSSSGGSFSYQWTTVNGNIVSGATTLTPTVDAGGTYTLEVTKGNCTSTDDTEVTEDTSFPTAMADKDGDLNCTVNQVTLNSNGSSNGPDFSYQWLDSNGSVIATTAETTVSAAGTYTLVVVDNSNGCQSSADVEVNNNTTPPTAEAGNAGELTCSVTEINLDGSNSSSGNNFTYSWITYNGNIVSGANTLMPLVNEVGIYYLTVIDNQNNCESVDSVVVSENINTPVSDFSVQKNNLEINLTADVSGNPSNYSWDFGDGNTSNDINPTHTYSTVGVYNVCLTITNECGDATKCQEISVTSGEITVNSEVIHVSCNGGNDGAINLDVSGVIQIIEYSWSNGESTEDINNLSAGVYTVTMTGSQGEEFIFSYTVNEPDAITMESIDIKHLVCYNDNTGKINPEVIGGVLPFSYHWSDGSTSKILNNAAHGEYSLTVTDANNCEQVFGPYQIENQPELTLDNIVITHPTCHDTEDGSISVNPSGGNGPINLQWSNGETGQSINNLSGGEFSVVLTDDHACTKTFGPYEVNQPSPISIENENVNNVSCNGANDGSIILDIIGGTGDYTFNWSNGASSDELHDLEPNDYGLEVTDMNGCISNFGPFTIEEPEVLEATATIEDSSNIEIVVSGGVEPYTYLWNDGSTEKNRNDLVDGIYSVEITDANGCKFIISDLSIGEVDVTEINELISIKVYPNPVTDNLFIEAIFNEDLSIAVTIKDLLGNTIYHNEVNGYTIKEKLNLTSYSDGYYILILESQEKVITRKFVKH